jgi:lysophospholipid acyltransferase (LPLAT)-like uncharacterized protein
VKLRHPALIAAAGRATASALSAWLATVRYRYRPLGPDLNPHQPGFAGRYLYAFWHEYILLPAYHYGRPDVRVLISKHADGQLITEVVERFGFRTVRGSTNRGGGEAVREMLRQEGGHLAVTPDGPRGPRREAQPGVAFLASRTGLPVACMGIAYDRPWRAGSWDRFAVPRPFSTAVLVTGEPLTVPPDLDRDGLEDARLRVQRELEALTASAEGQLAELTRRAALPEARRAA